MDFSINRNNEFEALRDPYPKTTEEWPEWVRKYKDAIRKDLNNKICDNCGYIPALIYASEKGATIYGKEYSGKEIFLCDECVKAISERLEKIESTIKERYPDKRLYGKKFNICFGDQHPVLYQILFLYFILSGLIVLGFLQDILGMSSR